MLGKGTLPMAGVLGVVLPEEAHTETHRVVKKFICATFVPRQELSKHHDGDAAGAEQRWRLFELRRGGIQRAVLRPHGGRLVLLPKSVIARSSRSHCDAADTAGAVKGKNERGGRRGNTGDLLTWRARWIPL